MLIKKIILPIIVFFIFIASGTDALAGNNLSREAEFNGIALAQDTGRVKSGKYSSRSRSNQTVSKTQSASKDSIPAKENHTFDRPLVIVDGVPVGYRLEEINADDIESLSILTEKTATDIYGERGKNGVILITTKKDKEKPVMKKRRKKKKN